MKKTPATPAAELVPAVERKIDPTKYLTLAQLSARWSGKPSAKTIENWRWMKRGPEWVKLGRVVLYPIEKVEAFERESGIRIG